MKRLIVMNQQGVERAAYVARYFRAGEVRQQPYLIIKFDGDERHFITSDFVPNMRGCSFDEIVCSLQDSDEYGTEYFRPMLADRRGKLVIRD